MGVGERPEEDVDRGASLLQTQRVGDGQVSVGKAKAGVRRDDVDVIRLEPDGLGRAPNRHARHNLQHFGEMAFVLGREMKHDHEGGAAVRRHAHEELLQGLDATRRRAEPHDQARRGVLARSAAVRRPRPR